jgi:hypothetical protein
MPERREKLTQHWHTHGGLVIVVDAVEELLQIHVHHPSGPFLDIPLCRAYSLMPTFSNAGRTQINGHSNE